MKKVNTHEAKTHFSRLLRRVAAGEEITIASRGVAVARLVPALSEKPKREPGDMRGKIWIAEDFDAPLPKEMLDAFEGKTPRSKDRQKRSSRKP